jgi:hypothetical protein
MTDENDFSRVRRAALADADRRRAFAVIVLEETDLALKEVSDLLGADDGLLREDDILWILEQRTVAPEARRLYWTRAARLLARSSSDAAVWNRIITLSGIDAEVATEFSYFLTPVRLDDPWVVDERARRRRVRDQAAARREAGTRVPMLITRGLEIDEDGRALAWPNLLRALGLGPDGREGFVGLETPPIDLPGWHVSSAEIRARITIAAKRYLEHARPSGDAWVGTNTIPGVEVCAYAALRLIIDVDRAWLDGRGAAFWVTWGATVLGYPARRDEGRRRLVHALYARAPRRVLALLPHLVANRQVLDELDGVWDPGLATALFGLLTTDPPRSLPGFRTLISRLLAHGDEATERYLVTEANAALSGQAQPVYLPELLLVLLTRRPDLWVGFGPRLLSDTSLALAVVRRWAATEHYEHYTRDVPERMLGDVYQWLVQVFQVPRRFPRGVARRFEGDQELASFRDDLPYAIAGRGTDEAFANLARLAEALPTYAASLREIERRARQEQRRQTWTPMTIGEARATCSA